MKTGNLKKYLFVLLIITQTFLNLAQPPGKNGQKQKESLNKKMEDIYYARGKQLSKEKKYRAAIEEFKKSLRILKNRETHKAALISLELANTSYTMGRYDDALQFAGNALALSRKLKLPVIKGSALMLTGMLHRRQHRYDKAIACFQEALEAGKEIGIEDTCRLALNDLWKEKGLNAIKKDQTVQALVFFKNALKFKPDDEEARVFMEAGYNLIGQSKQSEESTSEKTGARTSPTGDITKIKNALLALKWNKKGNKAYNNGEYLQAIQYYKKANQLFPGQLTCVLNLAGAYTRAKQFEEGEKILTAALNKFDAPGEQPAIKKELEQNLLSHALDYLDKSHYKNALPYFYRVLQMRIDRNDRQGKAVILQFIGLCYKSSGEYENAITYYRQSLKLNRHYLDPAQELVDLVALADSYNCLRKYTKALYFYEEALNVSLEVKDLKQQKLILELLGGICKRLTRYEKAAVFYEKVLSLNRETRDKPGELKTLLTLGVIHRHLSNYDKALNRQRQALTLSRQVKDRYSEGRAINNMGVVYGRLFEYSKALSLFNQALLIMRELGNRDGEAQTYTNIAAIYSSSRQFRESEQFFEKALHVKRELKDLPGQAVILGRLGGVYEDQHNYGRAVICFKQELNIALEIKDSMIQAKALVNLGSVHNRLRQYDRAVSNYKKALSIRRSTGDRKGEITVLCNLGKVYITTCQYHKAESLLKNAIELANDSMNSRGKCFALNNLGVLYGRTGAPDLEMSSFKQALELARQRKDLEDEEMVLFNLGAALKTRGQYMKAIDCFNTCLNIALKLNRPSAAAKTLNQLGDSYLDLGQYRKGESLFRRALDIALKVNDHSAISKTIANLGDVQYHREEYEKALSSYRKSLTLARKAKNRSLEIAALQNLSSLYYQQNNYEKALEYTQKAYDLIQDGENLNEKAHILRDFGVIHASRGHSGKGISYCNQALSIAQRMKARPLEADILNSLARMHEDTGQYEQALSNFRQALFIAEELRDIKLKGVLLNNIGLLYNYLCSYDKAIHFLEQALEVDRALKNDKSEKITLNNLGLAHNNAGRLKEALSYFHQAYKKRKKGNVGSFDATLLNNLGLLCGDLLDYDNAFDFFNLALSVTDKLKLPSTKAATLNNMALTYIETGKYQKALKHLTTAVKITKNLGEKNNEAASRFNTALALRYLNKNTRAIDQLEKAIDIKNTIRFQLTENQLKSRHFSGYIEKNKELVHLYFLEKKYAQAFQAAERSKSVVFAEMMAKRGAKERIARRTPAFRDSLVKESILSRQILNIKTKLKHATGTKASYWSQKLRKANIQFSTLQKNMKIRFPRYAALLYPGKTTVKEMQRILKDDETYVSFYIVNDYSIAFVISRRHFQTVKLDAGNHWIEEKISALRKNLQDSSRAAKRLHAGDGRRFVQLYASYGNYPRNAYQLYLKIVKPLTPYIKTKKILVSADGALYGWPLEALLTEQPKTYDYKGKAYSPARFVKKQAARQIPLFYEYRQLKYFADRSGISYIPNASSLTVLRGNLEKNREKCDGVIAFANPVFSNHQASKGDTKPIDTQYRELLTSSIYLKRGAVREWPPHPLPETEEEADVFVKQTGKGKVYKGLEASEKNVWNADLENAKYILFSTHGLLGKEAGANDIAEPALVLSLVNNPEGYDGLLGMTEAAGLRLNSDLVILSACNSAGESGKGGEGFAGMARSFLFAGSRAVVASHWPVNSRATKMLMEHYARHLKTKGRLEALEAAKQTVKNSIAEYGGKRKIKVSYAHPYFWASFVLLGER